MARRESEATYQRRRLTAVTGTAVVLIVLGLVIFGGGGEELTPEQARQKTLEETPVRLQVSVSGDLLVHSPVFARALELGGGNDYDFAPMLRQLRPYVADADLAFCHVETPMSSDPPQGFPIFNTPPELAEGIAETGWDACDTASNHTLDKGQEGIVATNRALDRAGVEHTGSYDSAAAQERPLIVESKGVRVAFLAYTTDTNGIPLPEPYSVNLARPQRILADAKRAKQDADVVVVNVHWASEIVPEYQTEPSQAQERLAERLTASPDITALVGQGPHIVQPIRRVGEKLVVFGEGNLLSNQSAACCAAGAQDGLIALLEIVVDGQGARVERVRYVPVYVSQPDYTVLPVGPAIEAGDADEAGLRASYERTTEVVGREGGVEPDPSRLPR